MKIHYKELNDEQLTVIVGRLAGQANARIENGMAWVGAAYDLLQPGRDHQEQVEKRFMLNTTCHSEAGVPIFVCNNDARTADRNPCRSRALGALLKTFPSGFVDID